MLYCKCESCGGKAKVDDSKILASYPPLYAYRCTCGHNGYVLTSEAVPFEIKVNKALPNLIDPNICINSTDLTTHCLVCGDSIRVSPCDTMPKLCDSCKDIVKMMKKEKESLIDMLFEYKRKRSNRER